MRVALLSLLLALALVLSGTIQNREPLPAGDARENEAGDITRLSDHSEMEPFVQANVHETISDEYFIHRWIVNYFSTK